MNETLRLGYAHLHGGGPYSFRRCSLVKKVTSRQSLDPRVVGTKLQFRLPYANVHLAYNGLLWP